MTTETKHSYKQLMIYDNTCTCMVISTGSQHSTTGVDLSTRQPLACTDTILALPIALVAHEKA